MTATFVLIIVKIYYVIVCPDCGYSHSEEFTSHLTEIGTSMLGEKMPVKNPSPKWQKTGWREIREWKQKYPIS
ncbi:DUF2225 domain-containing protein [Bacillus sp. CMF21]|uniref:DUF2225 domain-containing protein n=1 Tax=Metabacillus dongyingensis TaxID=2874282 RepID=UPI001CBB7250|nr:DUF2225 domain-containing protein [Metabacillus dongyingensis]UOK57563.1 DUF2225 domain-containing protein [Bacillus sp. OVS6]USK28016.1 DUF2225 domain-containing protein [Bacillus sp. CMF21]